MHGEDWRATLRKKAQKLKKTMLESNHFAVEVAEGTEAFRDPDLSRYDLIVPVITMSTIEKEEVENLCKTVEKGTGLAGFHGCMCDSFRNSVEYQSMTGGKWVAHPGNIIDFVEILQKEDPITEGIEDFPYKSEQYFMHVDPSNEVLATTTFTGEHCSWVKGVKMPLVWKRIHGEGRVFYSALGHDAEEFKVREMATMFERGMLWAAR